MSHLWLSKEPYNSKDAKRYHQKPLQKILLVWKLWSGHHGFLSIPEQYAPFFKRITTLQTNRKLYSLKKDILLLWSIQIKLFAEEFKFKIFQNHFLKIRVNVLNSGWCFRWNGNKLVRICWQPDFLDNNIKFIVEIQYELCWVKRSSSVF